MQERRTKKSEQAAATRALLLKIARRQFGELGYAGTGTEAIVAEAQVTRGALYFHFKDKRDLFRALVKEVAKEIRAEIEAKAKGRPWEALSAGCAAYLETCSRPDLRQIYLLDGPSALGWRDWREIDNRFNASSLRDGLEAAIGHVENAVSVDSITLLLSGAMNEAALAIADSRNPALTLQELIAGIEKIILGLRYVTR
jgi:AcrR family transcriptional regulator